MNESPGNETTAQAERFFPGADIAPVDGRAWLVSATTSAGHFSVRQLDPVLPAARIELLTEFLSQAGLSAATRIVASDRAGGAAFDARNWAPGAVLGATIRTEPWRTLHLPASIPAEPLGQVAASLGQFHSSGASTTLVARAPHFRAKEALAAVRRSLELDERALAGEIRKESRARRWLTAARPLLSNAETNLEQVGFLRDEPLVIAHLDLWGSHIVQTENGSATFLDCATIAAAPAVVDLAQLLARNGEWTDERVEGVINGYTASYPLQPLQRRVLPWLTALDAVGSCGRLLVRAHDERRPVSDNDRRTVFAAADQQLALLQTLATAFVPPPPRQYRRPTRRSTR